MLPVKDLDLHLIPVGCVDPSQRDMELREFSVEFNDQFPQIAAYCSWIDVIIVM